MTDTNRKLWLFWERCCPPTHKKDIKVSFQCHMLVAEETCAMVSNGVLYDFDTVVLERHRNVDEEFCKQSCINNTDCAVIVYHTGSNLCLLYDATQYSNGTADSSTTTFLKSCDLTFCMLNTLLTLQFICVDVLLCLCFSVTEGKLLGNWHWESQKLPPMPNIFFAETLR